MENKPTSDTRANHGLITSIPCKDMTFGIFKRKKPTIKKFQNYINKG